MSLFPAFAAQDAKTDQPSVVDPTPLISQPDAEWLENKSFAVAAVSEPGPSTTVVDISSSNSSDSSYSNSSPSEQPSRSSKKRKKEKQRVTEPPPPQPQLNLEFHNEDFYVDKAPVRMYKTVDTLHRPACPRYRLGYYRKLGGLLLRRAENGRAHKSNKRYYCQKYEKQDYCTSIVLPALDENEYTLRMGQLNRKTMEAPGELEPWLDLARLQDRNPYRWSRRMLAEKKLDYIQRALVYHARSEPLYRLYIDTINATYPSFEVSKMLDRLLAKDAHNYTLWTAQIMTTQGSMARCVVPDVLRIYERCMQKMHHQHNAQKPPQQAGDTGAQSDEVMLKLFNNCALFLRQTGLYEQFFALVKLALELNVSTDQFGDFAPLDADQRTLIEYEELILQSGLPMNEIWLRIEKLRQGFNFMPCPPNANCADPQRIVFNEDVCHYIYPMKRRENSFYLMLLILRLLKLPFVQCDGLAGRFCARVEDIGDSDAIEDMLAVCVRHSYALPQQQQDAFQSSLYELAKEMAVSPTFLSNAIGHEIYTRCLSELLLNCAAAQAGIDERKRIIFVLLWCRFERLLLVLQRLAGKLTAEFVKAGRGRFKALLKLPANRDVLSFYTEFALYEYEALQPTDALDAVRNTFENIIAAHAAASTQTHSAADLCSAYLAYAEILLGRGLPEQALHVIVAYALDADVKQKSGGSIGAAKKLSALQRLSEKVDSLVAVECNVEIMVLEQYLLPDYTMAMLKLRILLQCLVGQKCEALAYLDKLLLETFRRNVSARHAYLREHLLELYVMTLQLPSPSSAVSNGVISAKLFAALDEFPRNLFLLQRCAMLHVAPWYKVRSSLLHANPSIAAITFLIAAARYRFVQSLALPDASALTGRPALTSDYQHHEAVVRNRILNLFHALTPAVGEDSGGRQTAAQKALQRNALFWRYYLRCLSDQTTAFETSQRCLLTALDECPWSKALYLDGATYVPQELTRLQDLLIEKQMRICALPEELEILRER